jgi:hypothetical protein
LPELQNWRHLAAHYALCSLMHMLWSAYWSFLLKSSPCCVRLSNEGGLWEHLAFLQYQRKVGDKCFPEVLVTLSYLYRSYDDVWFINASLDLSHFIPVPNFAPHFFKIQFNIIILYSQKLKQYSYCMDYVVLYLNLCPIGFWDVKDPTLSRQSAYKWQQGFQPYAPAALYSPETFFCFWYSLLLEAEWTPGPSAAERIR